MIEIERKFLVRSMNFKREAHNSYEIIQGFLNTDPERTVRVRIKGKQGFITVKGKSNVEGTVRMEWEKEIAKEDALQLLNLCEPTIIKKFRYEVKVENHLFEVDEFLGDNEGLVIAEIELESENEFFEKPAWLGEEVTGQLKYYNSHLSRIPYKKWKAS